MFLSFMCSAGIAPRALRNKHLRAALIKVAQFGPLYTPPGSESLRTKYIPMVGKTVERKEQEHYDALRANKSGGTLCDDGWKDVAGLNLLNGTFVSPEGALFVRTADVSGKYKDTKLMFDSIVEMIERVGPSVVAHVVTDNAAVMAAARRLVEQRCVSQHTTPTHTTHPLKKNCTLKKTATATNLLVYAVGTHTSLARVAPRTF